MSGLHDFVANNRRQPAGKSSSTGRLMPAVRHYMSNKRDIERSKKWM
jgi:hypothetical protein